MTNLWLHNIKNKRIDNIKIDKMPKVDYVVANPPFAINNMHGSAAIMMYCDMK